MIKQWVIVGMFVGICNKYGNTHANQYLNNITLLSVHTCVKAYTLHPPALSMPLWLTLLCGIVLAPPTPGVGEM